MAVPPHSAFSFLFLFPPQVGFVKHYLYGPDEITRRTVLISPTPPPRLIVSYLSPTYVGQVNDNLAFYCDCVEHKVGIEHDVY